MNDLGAYLVALIVAIIILINLLLVGAVTSSTNFLLFVLWVNSLFMLPVGIGFLTFKLLYRSEDR